MELYMVCVLMAVALAMLIIKGIQCYMTMRNPLYRNGNGKNQFNNIKWKRSPKERFSSFDSVDGKKRSSRDGRSGAGEQKKKDKAKSKKSKTTPKHIYDREPLAQAEVPLEHIVSIEYIEDDLDETYEDRMGIGTRNSSSNITKSKHAHGTIV